jgi:hypothetical protein
MTTNRREFIERLGATAVVGALPLTSLHASDLLARHASPAGAWDMSWMAKVRAKPHKAIFDIPEVDSGYGVWRAGMWEPQHNEALGSKPADVITVVVLRHSGIALAFNQDYWAANKLGAAEHALHPITQQSTDQNPALLTSTNGGGVPAMVDGFVLPALLARGSVVLACNVALGFHAAGMAKQNNISEDEALKRATAALLPGIKIQPSGVFACVAAQEAGCQYVRAS